MKDIDKKKLCSLVENIKNNINAYSKREIDIVFGPMGSGKSTFIRTNLLDAKKVSISIDDYIAYIRSDEKYTVMDMYKRARNIGSMFTDILLELKLSMIIEGTGINDDMFEYLQRLKDSNYNIRIYILNTPLDICIQRVKSRNKLITRKISIDTVKDAYERLQKNLEKFRKYADEYCIVNVNEHRTGNENS